jgi:NAD-dependent deacetylase
MNLEEFTKKFIDQSKRGGIVAITGAGISTPSGVRDFRGKNGVYNEVLNAESILSLPYFFKHPQDFYKFYRKYMIIDDSIKPNKAHYFLKELEDEGLLNGLVTQNIDGLDKKAGTNNIIEIHGNGNLYKCINCSHEYDTTYVLNSNNVPICSNCGSILKPNIILYEEGIDYSTIENESKLIFGAKTLLVIGTRLEVNPTAELVKDFCKMASNVSNSSRNMKVFVINMGSTTIDKSLAVYKYDGSVIDFVDEYHRQRK